MERKYWIDYTKLLAMMLVFNSHMDKLYPVPQLASGGALGNVLFFLVCGYTWKSGVTYKSTTFSKWYGSKIKRIWIPTVFANIIYIILFPAKGWNLYEFTSIFLYPNKYYWFCSAVLVYAAIYFPVIRKGEKATLIACLIAIVVYFAYYFLLMDRSNFNVESIGYGKWARFSFYLICVLVGTTNKCHSVLCDKKWYYCTMSIILFAATSALKMSMARLSVLLNYQFVCQFLTLINAITIMKLFQTIELDLKRIKISIIVREMAKYTWEVYLVQIIVIPFFVGVEFPQNCIFSFMVTWVIATILHQLFQRVVLAQHDPTK